MFSRDLLEHPDALVELVDERRVERVGVAQARQRPYAVTGLLERAAQDGARLLVGAVVGQLCDGGSEPGQRGLVGVVIELGDHLDERGLTVAQPAQTPQLGQGLVQLVR